MPDVLIVSTGTANVASVCAAFKRLGAAPGFCESPDQIRTATHVILPGVGTFGAAMAELRHHAYDIALRERIEARHPTLCVCVGLQVLAKSSEESPGADGLGLLDTSVTAFPTSVRVPQFGWNKIDTRNHDIRRNDSCLDNQFLTEGGYAYFANSFRMTNLPAGWKCVTSEHGGQFVAAIESGGVLGCQFHPELSGAWGQALLGRWLNQQDTAQENSAC